MDQVEEVKQKTDIVSVISDYVDLKKAGRNYKANCPFHGEKTPSFMVSQELQIFKCFGCGESGDVISFLQKHEGMEFYEALKFLADKVGVKLKPFSGQKRSEKEELYKVNRLANHFYRYILLKHPEGRKALEYLLKERALKEETIKKFELGFSPDSPLALKKFLVDKKGLKKDDLEKAGLVYARNQNLFDRFRGRIIFPLFDHRGNICGFAGRVMPGTRADLAKYINTAETPVYVKSKLLYALNITRSSIRRLGYAVVVEGELDAISTWQTGIKNVVAIKGSALTREQLTVLGRLATRLIFALDSDMAGNEAAKRGINLAESLGFDIKVAEIKGYKDPDEAARKNPDKLKQAIRNAAGVWDFLIDYVFSKHKGGGGIQKAALSRELAPLLSSISDNIVRAHYIRLVAQRLKVPEDAVFEQVNKASTGAKVALDVQSENISLKKSRQELLEERFLALIFRYNPNLVLKKGIKNLLESNFAKRLTRSLNEYLSGNQKFDASDFAKSLPKELVEGYTDLVLKEIGDLQGESEGGYKRELQLIEKELKRSRIKKELQDAADKIKSLESKGVKKEVDEQKIRFDDLTSKLSGLDDGEFKSIIS